jgi:hypothetical protein
MSARVDDFCDKLRDRLNTIEGWLESARTQMQALPEQVRKDLRSKLEKAHAKLQAQKKRVEQTRADLETVLELPAKLFADLVIERTATPNVPETRAGVDTAEAHASATIDHAEACIDEVNDAMVYAAVARLHDAAK